jgi:hypothetical protein
VTATAAKPVSAATAESASARFARACFVHRQSPATQLRAVQGSHGLIGIRIYRHFHERKTASLTRIPVFHNLHSIHLAVCGKSRIEILLGCLERNVPDIDILQGVLLMFCLMGKLVPIGLISAGIWQRRAR